MENALLLAEIHVFCARTGMKPTTFGFRAVNDGKLVSRLEAGGSCVLDTAAKIRKFMQGDRQEAGAA